MVKTHDLKILPKYFKDIVAGYKTFELRKNDRGFKIGDSLKLREYENGVYGDSVQVVVTYILVGGEYGLDKEYVILGIE